MKTTVAHKGKTKHTQDVLDKPSHPLPVPIRELEEVGDSIVLGFRQDLVRVKEMGGVTTGAGLGSDFIILKWGERSALVRGSELLKAWVETFAPEDAARLSW